MGAKHRKDVVAAAKRQMAAINRLVEQRRAELGLSQAAVAHRAGITDRGLRTIKAGKCAANLATLVGLAMALEMSIVELVAGEPEGA